MDEISPPGFEPRPVPQGPGGAASSLRAGVDGPGDVGPADVGPAEAMPADAMPADAMPADAMPADAMPADAMPADAMPADAGPAHAMPVDGGPAPSAPAGRAVGDMAFAAAALILLMLVSLLRRPSDDADPAASLRSGWQVHGIAPALIDVNRASGDELAALPGVGPVLAARIAAGRGDGPYQRLDDLTRVPGVGPSALARLAPYVVFLDGDP